MYTFPRNACFFKELFISIITRMLVCYFLWNSSFKTSSQVFHNKCVPKKLGKTHGKLYMPASLFQKSWRLQVEKRLWYRCIPMNFVKFLRMTIYWYMCELLFLISWDIPIYGYPVQGPHWRNAQFSPAFWYSFISNWF